MIFELLGVEGFDWTPLKGIQIQVGGPFTDMGCECFGGGIWTEIVGCGLLAKVGSGGPVVSRPYWGGEGSQPAFALAGEVVSGGSGVACVRRSLALVIRIGEKGARRHLGKITLLEVRSCALTRKWRVMRKLRTAAHCVVRMILVCSRSF